jgi:hypothetical protein
MAKFVKRSRKEQREFDLMRLDSTLRKLSPIYLGPKKSRHCFDALDEREIGR